MTNGEKVSSFRWVVLALLFLNIFLAFLAGYSMPPLFKEISEQIPLTKAQMGMIMGMLTIPALVASPIGGGISDKVGSRWAFGVSILIVAAGGIARAFVNDPYGLTACMFIMGTGLAVTGPNLPKALGMWFPPKEYAMANGICMISMPLALTLAMGTAAGVLSPLFGGWRNVIIFIGILTGILGILWMIVYRERVVETAAQKKAKPSIIQNFKTVMNIKDFWWAAFVYAASMLGIMSLFTLLPNSLAERGLSAAKAGALVAIMTGTNAVFKVVGGTLSDRTGKRKIFLFLSNFILGLATILGLSYMTGTPLIIALVIAGGAMGSIAPIFMVFLVEIKGIGPALAGTSVGLIFMLGNVFGFVGPVVSGKLMDVTGAQWPAFVFMGVAFLIAAFGILPVKETGVKRAKEEKSAVAHG